MRVPNQVTQVSETCHEFNVTLKKPSLRYLDMMFRLRCGGDLLEKGIFPNAKEWTESMGMLRAISPKRYGETDTLCVVAGDGCSPRTGALAAHLTRWEVVSVDPRMRDRWVPYVPGVSRLSCCAERLGDYTPESIEEKFTRLVLLLPHAHIAPEEITKFVHILLHHKTIGDCTIAAMPCCKPQNMICSCAPDREYADWAVHSPERLIKVWHFTGRECNDTQA